MSGVELQEKLNSMGIRIPTIVMSAYADVPVTVHAMQHGALTLLDKPCRGMELWDAIRRALDEDARTRQQQLHRQETERRLETLTDQEQKVLELVLSGHPNKVIAKRLDLGLRTVETRRKGIFSKMQVNGIAELVQLIVEARGGKRGDP